MVDEQMREAIFSPASVSYDCQEKASPADRGLILARPRPKSNLIHLILPFALDPARSHSHLARARKPTNPSARRKFRLTAARGASFDQWQRAAGSTPRKRAGDPGRFCFWQSIHLILS